MFTLGKGLWALLALQLVASALITFSSAFKPLIAGILVYAGCITLLVRYVDRYATLEEAKSLFGLVLLFTGLGSVLGIVFSRTLYSAIVALSVLLVTFVYAIVILMVMSR